MPSVRQKLASRAKLSTLRGWRGCGVSIASMDGGAFAELRCCGLDGNGGGEGRATGAEMVRVAVLEGVGQYDLAKQSRCRRETYDLDSGSVAAKEMATNTGRQPL